MTAGFLGALLAALCYGTASVLQSVGSRRVAGGTGLDPRLLVRLAGQLTFVAGFALDLAGFAASVVALRTLPLFLVQAAVAASVGVTAVLAVRFLGARLRRTEVAALVGLGAGLVLLAVSARPEHAVPLPPAGRWGLLAGAGGVLLLGAVAARAPGRWATAGLATAAGLAFGGVGLAARVLPRPAPLWRIVAEPTAYALAAYGVLGILLFATALQRGAVTTATAIMVAAETVVPAAIGVAWLGDAARPGHGVVAGAGFALTLAGAVLLARYGEPPDQSARAAHRS
ncbi:MAG: hypothetical protein QOC93_2600 [Actinomycetota bacterium]|jgi:drug/metabolite transporter (DMT)-like permease|nr:hypothetical protein [Actinomycetota bacterium]